MKRNEARSPGAAIGMAKRESSAIRLPSNQGWQALGHFSSQSLEPASMLHLAKEGATVLGTQGRRNLRKYPAVRTSANMPRVVSNAYPEDAWTPFDKLCEKCSFNPISFIGRSDFCDTFGFRDPDLIDESSILSLFGR